MTDSRESEDEPEIINQRDTPETIQVVAVACKLEAKFASCKAQETDVGAQAETEAIHHQSPL